MICPIYGLLPKLLPIKYLFYRSARFTWCCARCHRHDSYTACHVSRVFVIVLLYISAWILPSMEWDSNPRPSSNVAAKCHRRICNFWANFLLKKEKFFFRTPCFSTYIPTYRTVKPAGIFSHNSTLWTTRNCRKHSFPSFNILHSVTTTWRMRELLWWKR